MLKDKRFWTGFIVAYLLVCLVPQVNFRSHLSKGSGNS
jgi:hypothetical protein